MAKSAKSAPRSRSGGSFLLGVFIGLMLGLGIAVGVAFYLNKTPLPFITKTKPLAARDAAQPPAVAGLPQPAAKSPEKPRFDFYKILPGSEETVSEKELKEAARSAKSQPESAKDVYYIQAGSFQNPADADNQKARLAILGFESSVESMNLPDKGTYYRVRLGPFQRIDELNRVRQALAQNGIDANLVKLKDPRTN
ncbi:MAG: SPOR domain-containing protein [Betaproteobacteria bacterium]|nr:MAG: SPOR domain-containing protein [Betaproteobacteria bacterium]